MTYLIDGRSLQDGSAVRGIGTYLRGLLAGYAELGIAGEVDLLLRRGDPVPPEVERLGLRPARIRIPSVKRRFQPLADPLLIANALRRLRPALYHGVDFGQPLTRGVPVVITVHDLIPFVFPHLYPWARRERLLALRLLRRADALIADSRSTARDLVRIAGADEARIHVVPLGVSADFHPVPDEVSAAVQARHGITSPYLLAVGTFDPRKRIDRLADVVAAARRTTDATLVIVGSQGAFAGAVDTHLERAGVAARTRILGHVPADDLVALYSGARALAFTSEYEGFGLPPLEAMACGCPVVMFDNSSLAEIAGDAAQAVPDGDTAAFAAALTRLIDDNDERELRRRRGLEWAATFTWRRTATMTLDVYRNVLGEGGGRP